MEPFRFRPAADTARAAETADAALAHALAHPNEATRAQLLAGVAARPDLTGEHIDAILEHLPHRGAHLIGTLLANPVIDAHPILRKRTVDSMGIDDIFTVAALVPAPERYLPQMLTLCMFGTSDKNIHMEFLTRTFAGAPMEAAVHTLLDGWEHAVVTGKPHAAPPSHTLDLDAFGPTHMERLLALVETATADAARPLPSGRTRRRPDTYEKHIHSMSVVEQIICHLLARRDLPKAASLRLVQHAEAVVADALAYAPPSQRDWVRASATSRMLKRAPLTPDAAAYAFASEFFRIGYDDINLTGPAIDAALIATADRPHRILVERALDNWTTRSPQVLSILLSAVKDLYERGDVSSDKKDHAVWSSSRRQPKDHETRIRGLIRAGLDHIGDPIWEQVYDLALSIDGVECDHGADHGASVARFAAMVDAAALNYADDSATPAVHRFAEWASASDDPHLRRHSVSYCWERAQLLAAAADPSPLVRVEVLAHNLATMADVEAAAADPDADVRLAAAEHTLFNAHILSMLSHDPDQRVRNAVAGRVMDALTS